jgi:dienelactone hydrolase
VALGGSEQSATALSGVTAAPAVPPAPAAAAAVAPVAAKAPVIDLLGGDDVYVPNGECTAWTASVLVDCVTVESKGIA